MNDLAELYQEIILDHGKSPRNHRVIEDASSHAEGFNPLCGDRVTVYLKTAGGRIEDASFIGAGCAICTASASMMTRKLSGCSTVEALSLFESFQEMLVHEGEPEEKIGELAALSGVRRFPMRVKCATLPWHTMKEALAGGGDTVSTES